MPTLIITVNLQCCRCVTKIQKVLCCMQERCEFAIEKIVYEKDTVVVSGPFDAEKLSCKLWCKAGKIITTIKIKPPAEEKKPKPPEPCKLIPFPYPYLPPQYCPTPTTWPCGCATPHCECHGAKPQPPPPPPPPPPAKPVCGCATPHCECHGAKPPPSQPPPPPPPAKPACGCPAWSSCHFCSPCSYPPPYMPQAMPYPSVLLCDESPQYGAACTVM